MTKRSPLWMLGGDMNQPINQVQDLLDAPNAYGDAPMGLFWSTGFAAAPSSRVMRHADHRVIRVDHGTVTAVVNCTWQWSGDEDLLQRVAEWADVMLLVEARTRDNRPLPIRDFISKTHQVRQNLTDSARSGSAIAVRRDSPLRVQWSQLTPLSPAGRNVQPRYLRTVQVTDGHRPTRYGAAHLGLPSTGVQDDGERALKSWVARARRA